MIITWGVGMPANVTLRTTILFSKNSVSFRVSKKRGASSGGPSSTAGFLAGEHRINMLKSTLSH